MTAALARKHLEEIVVLEDDTDTMVALVGRRVVLHVRAARLSAAWRTLDTLPAELPESARRLADVGRAEDDEVGTVDRIAQRDTVEEVERADRRRAGRQLRGEVVQEFGTDVVELEGPAAVAGRRSEIGGPRAFDARLR